MTAVAYTESDGPGFVYVFVWNLTTANPTGQALCIPGAADKTVEFDATINSGAWGGATAVLEGSLNDDGSGSVGTYMTLKDPNGNALSETSNAIAAVTEGALWIRPRLSTVGSGAAVQIVLMCRRTTP